MFVVRIFSMGGDNCGFFQVVAKRVFLEGTTVVKFHFANSETKRKNVAGSEFCI